MASEESNLLLSSSSSPMDYEAAPQASRRGPHHVHMQHSYLSRGSSSYSRYVPLLLATIGIAISAFSFLPFLHQQESLHSRLSTAGLPLLGKSKDSKRSKNKKGAKAGRQGKKQTAAVLEDDYDCKSDSRYSKHTLKGAYDLPYAALFHDTRGQSKFEASDVTIVDNTVYSVCDSSWAISKFARELSPFSKENVQIGNPDRVEDEESGYEAIFEHDGLFYVVRESVYHEGHDHEDIDDDDGGGEGSNGDYHAIIEELLLQEDDYTVKRECQCEYTFEGDSKGFEGAVGYPDENDQLYVIGLCEGNHCSEEKKNDVGNGRVILMTKKEGVDEDGSPTCLWETIRVVRIPQSAAFLDYSAIDITPNGRVVISSQEHSSVWLGHTTGISNGIIDPEAFEFVDKDSSVLQFPKDGGCHTIYCNIEGVHFMNDEMLMAVSDKMKSKGRQDFRCHEKDQSIHAFVIP